MSPTFSYRFSRRIFSVTLRMGKREEGLLFRKREIAGTNLPRRKKRSFYVIEGKKGKRKTKDGLKGGEGVPPKSIPQDRNRLSKRKGKVRGKKLKKPS